MRDELKEKIFNEIKVISDYADEYNPSTDKIMQLIDTYTEKERKAARIDEVKNIPRADYNTVDEYIDNRLDELKKGIK